YSLRPTDQPQTGRNRNSTTCGDVTLLRGAGPANPLLRAGDGAPGNEEGGGHPGDGYDAGGGISGPVRTVAGETGSGGAAAGPPCGTAWHCSGRPAGRNGGRSAVVGHGRPGSPGSEPCPAAAGPPALAGDR